MKEKTIKELLNFGIINIDKSSGPTSFTISDYVKRSLGLKKTSHFGTLDPKFTGVLPIALGRACKLTGYFLGHNKTYVGILHTHKDIEIKELQKIIDKNFVGKIKQTPPVKSRVKREEREREVKEFKILEKNEKDFLFLTDVEGGTYIRKLCSDLGEMIDGAHMLELRRIKAGIFDEKTVVNLHEFEKAVEEYKKGNDKNLKEMIVPAEEAIKKILPILKVKKSSIRNLMTGKPVLRKDISGKVPEEKTLAVFTDNQFVEIAEKADSKGELVAKPLFVFN